MRVDLAERGVSNLSCAASLNINEGKITLPHPKVSLIGYLAFMLSEPSVN